MSSMLPDGDARSVDLWEGELCVYAIYTPLEDAM